MQHPSHRLFQLAFKSLGYDPRGIDGWWGRNTQAAGDALLVGGPVQSTVWAVKTLQRALVDLGYPVGEIDGNYGPLTREALLLAVEGQGASASGVVRGDLGGVVAKPALPVAPHGKVLRHGTAGATIRGLMMHTAATPGRWCVGKSNQQMLHEIRGWHANPVSAGGRGWLDIGYQEVIFPDGEALAGRSLDRIPAGAKGYNTGWLHICMVPVLTITAMGLPEDFYTPDQLDAMRARVEHYSGLTPIDRLAGHNEVAAKLCPGFRVIDSDWTDGAVA